MRFVGGVALLAMLACTNRQASLLVFPHADECGTPFVESTTWPLLDHGTLVEVISGNEFMMRLPDGTQRRVRVTNVGDGASKMQLDALLRAQPIDVWVPLQQRNAPAVEGTVRAGTVDVAEALLASGAAPYVQAAVYATSSYQSCIDRTAEREAKAAHRGMWAH
jgi:hypothetical protein